MDKSIEDAEVFLSSSNITSIMFGIKILGKIYKRQRTPEIMSRILNFFFYKNSCIKKTVLNILRKKKLKQKSVILDYRREIFAIIYSNDKDSLDALSKILIMFSDAFKSDDEIFFELFRKQSYRAALIISKFCDSQKYFLIKNCISEFKKDMELFYFASKCNPEYLKYFINHCISESNYEYLLKAISKYPFIPKLYKISIGNFTKNKCKKGFLTSKEAKSLFKNFEFFEPEFCKKKMKIVTKDSNLTYWEKWLFLLRCLKKKDLGSCTKILDEICAVKSLNAKYRYIFSFYNQKLMKLMGKTFDKDIFPVSFYIKTYAYEKNKVYRILKKHYRAIKKSMQ